MIRAGSSTAGLQIAFMAESAAVIRQQFDEFA